MTHGDVARRLHELITALDRRVPRSNGGPAEAAIALDAASLRKQAVDQLVEIAGHAREKRG